MKLNSKGFTLIELMIVIAIIGILSTVALPSFQAKVIRSQVSESMDLAKMAQNDIEAFYQKTGKLPTDNQQAGLPEANKIIGNFTKGIQVDNGIITITLGNRINKNALDKTITLRPATVKDAPRVPIAWVCGGATTPDGMTVAGTNNGTLEFRLLPIECRF